MDAPDWVRSLLNIDSPTLANAIEKLNVRNRATGFASRAMRQLTAELGVMCGYAVTAEAITMTAEPSDRRDDVRMYLEVAAAIERSPKPAVVVIQEFGPHPEFSAHVGQVMATLFKRFGAIGVVSDSAVRDLPEVRAMGVHLFAPGTVASHANFHIQRVQAPVCVCGLTVQPGDLLHGDVNGLISVPVEGRQRLLEMVEQVRAKEKVVLEYLSGAAVTMDGVFDRMTH